LRVATESWQHCRRDRDAVRSNAPNVGGRCHRDVMRSVTAGVTARLAIIFHRGTVQ
jgi:hypothetical protein